MWPFSSPKSRTANRNPRRRPSFRPRLQALEDRCLLSGGVLDPTFGTGGLVNSSVFPGNLLSPHAIATYPHEGTANDGKIVIASSAYSQTGSYAVVRYNLNGTVDKTFGVSGQATTKLGTSSSISAYAVAVQPDGKVLAAGYPDLVRYNVNGTLDTTFGKNGEVVLPVSARYQSMSLQADGEIVVVGAEANDILAVARYNANGSLDSSFGTGGTAAMQFAAPIESAEVALDAGTSPLDPNAGKIVVAAEVGWHTAIARFNADGSVDTAFGGNGTGYVAVSAMILEIQPALAIQSDDRIVVASTVGITGNPDDFCLARLNPDGTPDATFGSGGFEAPALPITSDIARSVAIQANGAIVVAGANKGDEPMLARYNAADGSLDTSFGSKGVAVAKVGGSQIGWVPMALEPDGRIVVAGTGGNTSGLTTFVARFLATGPQIGSFMASPNLVTSGGSTTLTASGITDGNPSSTITQVTFYYIDSSGTKPVLGQFTQTSPGVWTLNFTVGLASGTYTLYAQAQDNFGVLGDPLGLTLQVS